ncbi:MAG: hypothetical protein L0206_05720 [Actinobacteria bacterium]|nr:hypothetical protein [Actinomycetota bacterium]
MERAGLHVREYSCGEEVLADAQDGLPSVLLVEVRLPGICGYEVCWQLRQEFAGSCSRGASCARREPARPRFGVRPESDR